MFSRIFLSQCFEVTDFLQNLNIVWLHVGHVLKKFRVPAHENWHRLSTYHIGLSLLWANSGRLHILFLHANYILQTRNVQTINQHPSTPITDGYPLHPSSKPSPCAHPRDQAKFSIVDFASTVPSVTDPVKLQFSGMGRRSALNRKLRCLILRYSKTGFAQWVCRMP